MATLTFTELHNLFRKGIFIRHVVTCAIFIIILMHLYPSEQEMHDMCFTGLDGSICPEGFAMNITNGEVQCYDDFCIHEYGAWAGSLNCSIIFIFLGLLMDSVSLIGYIISPGIYYNIIYISMIAYFLYMMCAAINILFMFSFEHIKIDNYYIIYNTILLILHIAILYFEVNLSDVLHKLKGSDFFAKEKEPVQAESDKVDSDKVDSDKVELLQVESEQAENSTKE